MSLSKNIIKIVALCIAPTILVACGGGSSSSTPTPDFTPPVIPETPLPETPTVVPETPTVVPETPTVVPETPTVVVVPETPQNPLFFEAETSTLLGSVVLNDNTEASNGQLVSDFLTGSDGILILDSPESIAFKLTYSSTSTVDLNVQINQTLLKPILTSTENVLTSTLVEADISAGDRITITTEEGNDNFQLDSLAFIENPLQQVSTLANAGFGGGDGISVSPDGDVYVSSGGSATEGPGLRIEKISKAGEVSTFTTGFVSANGSDFDSMGNLYVADYEANVVRKVDTEGNVTTFASNLDGPAGVYVDQQDNVIVGLYGANFSGQANTVLSITPEGNSSILATGSGLINIIGVAGDENGVIYAGSWDTGRIFKITDGEVELLADTPVNVNQITYSRGYVYVFGGGRILRISTSGDNIGNIEVFSGSSNNSSTVNGIVADAEYNNPNAGSFSDNGNILYVYDSATGDVRKITFDENVLENFGETVIVKDFSTVSTVANIGFSGSDGIAVAANGNVYISGGGGRGNVTLITPDGTVSVFDTGYQYAIGGEVDSNDNLYIADWGTGVINKFTPEGEKSIFASGISNPGGMHFDSQDNMILAYENGVMRITPDGNREVIYSGDGNYMTGDENDNFYLGNWTTGRLYKLVDGVRTFIADLNANINGLDYYNGYIYIAGVETSQIFKVDAITGEIEILAGTRTDQVIDGPIATADFDAPNDIAVSPDGQSIYVIERDTGDLRKISIE